MTVITTINNNPIPEKVWTLHYDLLLPVSESSYKELSFWET